MAVAVDVGEGAGGGVQGGGPRDELANREVARAGGAVAGPFGGGAAQKRDRPRVPQEENDDVGETVFVEVADETLGRVARFRVDQRAGVERERRVPVPGSGDRGDDDLLGPHLGATDVVGKPVFRQVAERGGRREGRQVVAQVRDVAVDVEHLVAEGLVGHWQRSADEVEPLRERLRLLGRGARQARQRARVRPERGRRSTGPEWLRSHDSTWRHRERKEKGNGSTTAPCPR